MKWIQGCCVWKRASIYVLVAALGCSFARGQALPPPVALVESKAPLPSQTSSAAPIPLPPPPAALPISGGTWVAQGPSPINNGGAAATPNNAVNGAIEAVAVHPTNADIVYIATINGGVWKTTNATAASPTWTPLIDAEASLSMGALQFDPTDANHNTLLAGIGRFSSLARLGGARTGLLRTTDGGSNWTPLDGGGTLAGANISGVAARGATLVASVDIADSFTCSNIGIFRSTNTGTTFSRISGNGVSGLPYGTTFDLAGDPSNSAILYTATKYAPTCVGGTNGVYKSTDTGQTWSLVSDSTMNALFSDSTTSNVRISVGASDNIYVGIVNSGRLAGLFRSGNGGSSWTALDLPFTTENGTPYGIHPGGQGGIHFSILADPSDANVVYVGGDRQPANNENGGGGSQFPNSIGATNYTGRLFRVDASLTPGSQFTHLTNSNSMGPTGGGTASNTAPHADSRDMGMDANGDLLEVDDGGVFRRTNPLDNTGDWFSIVGSLQATEFHDIAYDTNSQIIFGGAQDNGSAAQQATGGTAWQDVLSGDGADVETRLSSTPNMSLRYMSAQNLQAFLRATYNAANVLQSFSFPALNVTSGAALVPGFYSPIKVNAIDPNRILIAGTNSLYESTDQGSNLSELPGSVVVNDSISHKALVYGGTSQAVNNADLIYAGAGSSVMVRTAAPPAGFTNLVNYPGGQVNGIVVDPTDYRIAYVVDQSHVYWTTDTGASWNDITGDLAGAFTGSIHCIEFVSNGGSTGIVVGTDQQVFISLTGSLGTWNQLGTGLPNARVARLSFDPANNTLFVGTLGRGAWKLSSVVGEASKRRRGQVVSD